MICYRSHFGEITGGRMAQREPDKVGLSALYC